MTPSRASANTHLKLGEYGEAAAILGECLARRERRFGPDDADVAAVRAALGTLLANLGRYAQAGELYQAA